MDHELRSPTFSVILEILEISVFKFLILSCQSWKYIFRKTISRTRYWELCGLDSDVGLHAESQTRNLEPQVILSYLFVKFSWTDACHVLHPQTCKIDPNHRCVYAAHMIRKMNHKMGSRDTYQHRKQSERK